MTHHGQASTSSSERSSKCNRASSAPCAPSLRAFFRRYLSDRVRVSLTVSSRNKKFRAMTDTQMNSTNPQRSYQSRNRDKEPGAIDMQVLTTHRSANEELGQPAMGAACESGAHTSAAERERKPLRHESCVMEQQWARQSLPKRVGY